MARFLGTAAGRASGGGGGGGLFTKAKVFTNAGSTTYDVPSGTKHVKVFVVGAGSCYRPGTYCFNSENCCSGVNNPRRWYRACFCGHLTGAGGGYSEKTWTAKDHQIAGKQLTVVVGSQGGQSASSVDGTGLTAVSAANANETSYSWACTSNSTARDNSNDNPIEGGFYLPRCGYQNSFSGYYNSGGSASGGDVNRTGGKGVMIPEFLYDSCMDAFSQDISGGPSGGGGGGNTNSCWVNPTICCMCWRSYHQVFGNTCQFQAWCCFNCTCYYLCQYISSLCSSSGGGPPALGGQPRKEISFYYRGKNFQEDNYESSCSLRGRFDNYSLGTTGAPRQAPEGTGIGYEIDDTMAHVVPKGIGGSSGYSAGDGSDGRSEGILADVTPYNTLARCEMAPGGGGGGGGPEITVECSCTFSYGYDYSFGGSAIGCVCYCYYPGSFSSDSNIGASGQSFNCCNHCAGFGWNYVFGSQQSNQAMCWMMPYGQAGAGAAGDQPGDQDCVYRTCYNMSYLHDVEAGKVDTYTIPLSTLINHDTEGNQTDVEYGRGATLTSAALPGGGGNREYPAGGSGMVVLVYG
tara:strand:- start:773 stop:2497 length:1725 start_codon:yes stop_codon:yes gene_type:complete